MSSRSAWAMVCLKKKKSLDFVTKKGFNEENRIYAQKDQ